ncbi:chorismate mutase [Thermohalobacter berrensis]|uniref:chorismate mutase n=1 Tax=Thermohalobacter berrensis TaxID=99594 RepID=A0A419TAM7_9FIRM|nr:chorismate mutase [Thermohalobacter berrensis]RKD34523.1 chorismate mutase [Thermohalobacter berrensis]
MRVVSVRGAITVEKNTKEDIVKSTEELLNELLIKNNIHNESVISIIFSSTKDLNKEYPAFAARKLGFVKCGLMCFQEMEVENSLKKCIRVLILFNSNKKQSEIRHVYLKDAIKLRPDLL